MYQVVAKTSVEGALVEICPCGADEPNIDFGSDGSSERTDFALFKNTQ